MEGALTDLIPFLLIVAIMYFLLIRPQIQEKDDHDRLLASLVRDDRVVTKGGLHGRIVEVREDTILLDIGDKTRVTFDRAAVIRRQGEPARDSG